VNEFEEGGVSSTSEGGVLLEKLVSREDDADNPSQGSKRTGGGEERGEELQKRGGSERLVEPGGREASTLMCRAFNGV